jgi:putative flippase GtrA
MGRHEAKLLARASISSLAATVADGAVYQLVLLAGTEHYVLAAFLGALCGAVTNFTLNRTWAFPATDKPLATQGLQYAAASGLTYVGLQACLVVLIEHLQVDARLAWVPAKVLVWLVISYPLHRFVVFAGRRAEKEIAR